MHIPDDAVWVRVHPSNPRAKEHPTTGWCTKEQWASKFGGMDLFRLIPVHFKNETVELHAVILRKAQ